ncbi:MAG: GNAT family N-acetyltransferase [Sphingobium sp.]
MTSHPLDRPIWNALATGWSARAHGDARARRLDPEYGPFGAAADDGPQAQAALAALAPEAGELWLVEAGPIVPPPGVQVAREAILVQMIASVIEGEGGTEATVLTEADAAEMRALAHLTKPGPFHPLTHRLGRFIGIRRDGRLIAMAGERMRMPGFAEVSGVCTHPDHRGQGHAGGLMRLVARRMLAQGETPFLHAYAANKGAIALYGSLGFRVRAKMHMVVVGAA